VEAIMRNVWVLTLAAAMTCGVAQAQLCEPDLVWAEIDGDQVTVHHENAEFNCCPIMEYQIVQNGSLIDIFEVEVEAQCFCDCCFDLMHAAVDLAPGPYTARVWGAYGCDPEPCGTVDFTIEEGQGSPQAFTLLSNCGGWTGEQVVFADGFERGNSSRWD
jgi:hypothetical protein